MPIRINLLAEEQAAEEMRRKNPVKLGIWVGGFIVFVVGLWILKLQFAIQFSQSDYAQVEQSWKSSLKDYSAVTNNTAKIAEVNVKLSALETYSTNRFYWASVLNSLQQSMIKDIQVVKLIGTQKYAHEDQKITGSGTTKRITPASSTESVSISIDGKDFNPAAQNYDRFKESLCNSEFFVKGLGRRDGFLLETVSTPTADPSDASRQFVTFKLICRYPEVRRE